MLVQHSDWLTQLNLQILDNGDNSLSSTPYFGNPQGEQSSTDMGILWL